MMLATLLILLGNSYFSQYSTSLIDIAMFPLNIHDVLTCLMRHSDDVMRYSTSADVSHSTDTVLWTLCSAVKLEHFR